MEDQNDINLVINLLELTFRAGKDQDRSSAETQLNKLALKSLEITSILLKITAAEQINGISFLKFGNFSYFIQNLFFLFIRVNQRVGQHLFNKSSEVKSLQSTSQYP